MSDPTRFTDLEVTGAFVPASGTQAVNIAAVTTDYATPGLDTEAEIIVAFNATNTKLNAIITALEGVGILADE